MKRALIHKNLAEVMCSIFWLFALVAASAQSSIPDATTEPRTLFRIGYLRGDPEAQVNGRVVEEFRSYLLATPSVVRSMKAEGISDIAVQASDSHQNLREWWMSQNQVDMAFCSALDYVWQRGNYEPLFQFRGGIYGPGGERYFHRGVLFVGNSSILYKEKLRGAELGTELEKREIAMVSHSAAGYVYPSLRLADMTSNTLPQRPVFCESSEEVVKYVLSGIVEAGACEKGVLDDVLEMHGLAGQRDKLLKVVLETDLVPTDPVVLQEQWLPRKSAFGRELKKSLREFFRKNPSLPRLEDTSAEAYGELRENLVQFQKLQQKSPQTNR